MMTDYPGEDWNVFTALKSGGRLLTFPGRGGYTKEDTVEYFRRVFLRNHYDISDPKLHGAICDYWMSDGPFTEQDWTASVFTYLGLPKIVGIYRHSSGSSVEEPIISFLSHTVKNGNLVDTGIPVGTKVQLDPNGNVLGKSWRWHMEFRAHELISSLGLVRTSPSMDDDRMTLLETDDAILDNWIEIRKIMESPDFDQDTHDAASYVLGLISGSRNDLLRAAKSEGIRFSSDPDLKKPMDGPLLGRTREDNQ